jgi:hypothetical protein
MSNLGLQAYVYDGICNVFLHKCSRLMSPLSHFQTDRYTMEVIQTKIITVIKTRGRYISHTFSYSSCTHTSRHVRTDLRKRILRLEHRMVIATAHTIA